MRTFYSNFHSSFSFISEKTFKVKMDGKLFFLLPLIGTAFAIWSLDIDPSELIPCMPDGKWHLFDLTDFQVISDFKTQKIYMNGSYKFLKKIDGVIALDISSERFHRGKWIPGEFKNYQPDFCKYLNDPLGQPIAYLQVQRALKKKSCPYPAGHVESMSNYSVWDSPITFPPQYMDMWKFYMKFYKDEKLIECIKFEGEIID